MGCLVRQLGETKTQKGRRMSLMDGRRFLGCLLALSLGAFGCGDDAPVEGAGDAGPGSFRDAGGGRLDAGVGADGGALDGDGGAGNEDAGVAADAGSGGDDAGSSVPEIHCDEEDRQAVTGRPMCRATIEGIQTEWVMPQDSDTVEHIGFYFHGDGGQYKMASLARHADWGADKGLLLILMTSPVSDRDRPDIDFNNLVGPRWWLVEEEHVQAVGRVIDGFLAQHPAVDPRRMLYYSASGGSQFMTQSFVTMLGHRFGGLMAITCGGGRPRSTSWRWEHDGNPLKADILLRFHYGSEDFLADQIERNMMTYRDLGFDVEGTRIEGAHHCGGDTQGFSMEQWQSYLME